MQPVHQPEGVVLFVRIFAGMAARLANICRDGRMAVAQLFNAVIIAAAAIIISDNSGVTQSPFEQVPFYVLAITVF